MIYDKLHTPAHIFYTGAWAAKESLPQAAKRRGLDAAGQALYVEAARAQYKHDAKTQSWLRRGYSAAHLSRSEDGESIYLSAFEDVGARDIFPASDQRNGWYTDDFQSDTLKGVVIVIGRHEGDTGIDSACDGWKGSAGLFMAGTKHSDWDGVTLYTDTFDNFRDAARYADRCAEREAQDCREADEKNRREQRVEEMQADIKHMRTACLALLRDMKPIRKGGGQVPETVCDALRNQVQRYLNDIRTCRDEIGELS